MQTCTRKSLKARILSLALSVVMAAAILPSTVFATEKGVTPLEEGSEGIIKSFEKLGDEFFSGTGDGGSDHIYSLSVKLDTTFEELKLPDELNAMVERINTDTKMEWEVVPVIWNSDKEYKSDENGEFIFTPELPGGYRLEESVKLPQISVIVGGQVTPIPEVSVTATYSIYVADTDVTTSEYWKTESDGSLTSANSTDYNVRWENSTQTLYLRDLVTEKRKTGGWNKSAIQINSNEETKADINVIVEGESKLALPGGSESGAYIAIAGYLYGGTLNFSGSGSLTASDKWSGIYVDGNLNFNDSGTYVFASDGRTDVGISASKIIINDNVKVSSEGGTYGLYTRDIAIGKDAQLTCHGGTAAFLGDKATPGFTTVISEYSSDGVTYYPGVMELNTFNNEYNNENSFYTVKDKTSGAAQKWARFKELSLVEDVAFKNLTANGVSGITETTELTLTFDKDVTGLVPEDIILTGATKGTLEKGEGTGVYKLTIFDITVNEGETVSAEVSKTGFKFTPTRKTVEVHKPKPTTYTVDGTITGSDTKVGIEAKVELKDKDGKVVETKTDPATGHYSFSKVTPGEGYTITASTTGYEPKTSEPFSITNSNIADKNLELEKKIEPVAVTGVKLNKEKTTLAVGGEETLTATVTPENATNKAVNWTSDKAEVVTVDEKGKVTAKAAGAATITVTTEDGNKTATCIVAVTGSTYPVVVVGSSEWMSNAKEGITFKVEGDFKKIIEVRVNGKTLDKANYTAKDGVITLKPEYLKTLAVGKYTVDIVFTDGQGQASFSIKAVPVPSPNPTPTPTPTPNPTKGTSVKTGVTNNNLFDIMLPFALTGLAVVLLVARKRKEN